MQGGGAVDEFFIKISYFNFYENIDIMQLLLLAKGREEIGFRITTNKGIWWGRLKGKIVKKKLSSIQ